jgi:hypothetical protein
MDDDFLPLTPSHWISIMYDESAGLTGVILTGSFPELL